MHVDGRPLTQTDLDLIQARQELATLKGKISESLKLDVELYNVLKDEPCTEDNHEAAILALKRTFRTLRRLGIDIEA